MAVFNMLYRFVRLGPLALGAIALVILGLGVYLQFGENERNALKLQALQNGAPAAVDITKFNADTHIGAQREVVVRAQPLIEHAYRLTLEKDGGDDYAYMVPLVSPDAASERVIFGVALYSSNRFTFDDLTPDLLMEGVVGFGNYGPIVDYNGVARDLGKWEELTKESFAIEGLTMAANDVIVWPYLEGRTAALTPSETTIFGLMSKIAGVIGLLALGKLIVTNKPDKPAKPAAPTAATAARAPLKSRGVPLWKQRSGLADDTDVSEPAQFDVPDFDPEPAQTAALDTYEDAVDPPARTSRFGLRKALIGIIGLAFAVLLASTVLDTIQNTVAEGIVSIPTQQERAADRVADAVVPDADPNRHWTDIDVTPIAEWFVAKAVMAQKGDKDAQLTLGMMAGGVIVVLMMLRFFLRMRRALGPKTTARFDSMGIN